MNLAIITATSSLTDKEEKKVIILPFASFVSDENSELLQYTHHQCLQMSENPLIYK